MPEQLCRTPQEPWNTLCPETVDELIGVLNSDLKGMGNKKVDLSEGGELRRLMLKSPDELQRLYSFCISYLGFFFRFEQKPRGLKLLMSQPLTCFSIMIFETYKDKVGQAVDAVRDFPCVLEVFFKDFGLNSAILEYFLRRSSYRDIIRRYLKLHYIIPDRRKKVFEMIAHAETMEELRYWCKLCERLLKEIIELEGSKSPSLLIVPSIRDFLRSKVYPFLDGRVQNFRDKCKELQDIAIELQVDCQQRQEKLYSGDSSIVLSEKSIRHLAG